MTPTTKLRWLSGCLLALVLTGCGSTPVTHYYTLLPPAGTVAPAAKASLQFEMLPLDLPAQVDRQEMVVREDGELVPVDTRQWAAPLGNELQNAFSVALARKLGAHDVYGLPHDAALPTYRIKISVQRFDSALGGSARIDAAWSVQKVGDEAATVCSSSATENLASGYEALAAGQREAIEVIADQIASSLSAANAGHSALRCPTG